MISYANEPWKKRGLSSFLNQILAVMFLGIILLSYSFMLGNSKALAEPNAGVMETCSTVIVAGDVHAVEDESAGLHKKLKDSGVKTIKSYTHEGRRTNEVVNAIRSVDPRGKCFIIEAGTGNLHDKSSEQNKKEINRMAEKLKDANKVYWVSPVISGDRSDLGVSSKQFNDDLEEVLKDKGNFNIINAQKLSTNSSYFDKDSVNGAGMRMTPEGYNQRVDLILGNIEEDLKIETPTSTSSSPSSNASQDPSQAPEPAPGGDQAPPSGGGDQTPPGGNEDGGQDTDPKDPPSENWRTDSYSPLKFAEKLDTMHTGEEASRYLTLTRWGVPSVPLQRYSPDNNSFQLNPQSQKTEEILSGAHTAMMGGYAFLNVALNSGFGTLALQVGDSFYGKFFGLQSGGKASLNGDNKAAFALLSSIFMISFMLAGWRSLSSMSMSPKQRVSNFFTSIAKTSMVMAFAIVSGTMSKANRIGDDHNEQAMEQIADGIVNRASESNIDFDSLGKDEDENDADELDAEWKKALLSQPSNNKQNPNINMPSSWRTFSLGWIVSMIYEAGKLFSFAVVSIITIFITGPIESMRSAIARTDTVKEYHNDGVCERYVDAMHVAYGHTAAMASSPSAAMAIRSFDLIYYDLIYTIYSRTYGDNTDSTEKGWCWYAEVNSNVHPGEYMMLMRTAGNYGYVIGTGDLITGRNAAAQAVYTSGEHSMLSIDGNLSNNTTKSGGTLVDASGKWTGGDSAGAVRRAEAFMGVGRGINGTSEAKFYHAACDYPRGSTEKPTLSKEWENVIAMFEENDESDEEKDNIIPITNTIWFAQDDSSEEGEGEDEESSGDEKGEDNGGEAIEAGDGDGDYSRYLTDEDCVAPVDAIKTIVEKPGESDPAGKWGGFGTMSEDGYEAPYASRWNYEQETEGSNHGLHTLTALKYASGGIKRRLEENDADKPSGKFHINESTVDGDGRIRDSSAKDFWIASTGQSAKGIMSAKSSGRIAGGITAVYAAFSTVMVAFAFFVNLLAFILFFFITAIVGFALLKFAMFGGSRRLK